MFAVQSRAKEADYNQMCSQPLVSTEVPSRHNHFPVMIHEGLSGQQQYPETHTGSHINPLCFPVKPLHHKADTLICTE